MVGWNPGSEGFVQLNIQAGMGWIELHGSFDERNLVVDRMHGVEWHATSGASKGASPAKRMGQLRQRFLVLCGVCPC